MLRIENLTKTFDQAGTGRKVLFTDFSLQLEPGSFTVLIGANGSGKSSLLNLISGSLKPDKGKVFIGDKEVSNLDEVSRSRYVSRVFQQPHMGTAGELSMLENFRIASLHLKRKSPFSMMGKGAENNVREQVKDLHMGLENILHREMQQLSGGQRQALSVLMAVVPGVPLLLMDEPSAALDPAAGDLVMDLANAMIQKHRLTAVLVTHNMKHAVCYGDRLIQLQEGKILRDVKEKEKTLLKAEDLHAWFEK